jgi:hypothetical protein
MKYGLYRDQVLAKADGSNIHDLRCALAAVGRERKRWLESNGNERCLKLVEHAKKNIQKIGSLTGVWVEFDNIEVDW